MPNTKINEVDLYYEIHGEGSPLMLIAGLASDSQSWQPIMEDLAQDYRIIAPDNRGTGRTRPQDAGTSIRQIADDCLRLIKHLQLSSVHLLGHSMGGFVALDLAIRYPDTVNKLVVAGTSSFNSTRNNSLFSNWVACMEKGLDPDLWFHDIFHWLFSARFFENQSAVNEAVRYAVEYPYPQSTLAFRNQVNAIVDYDCTEALSTITAATMVISGKEDLLFPPEVCARLAQQIPESTFRVVEDAAHSIHMEQPQAFTQAVLDFLHHR